uniref:ATP synthase F0 subunit 8 n=1 Tax=Enchytraeus irregularis TaxID=2867162 RepID=UPI0022FD7CE8|nr:ATP synthase F0 subunit 8 [Enchytraeus irregularis]WAS35292.1 ATP synthase F0 subunit 8 [Enchytraeus irregularis]
MPHLSPMNWILALLMFWMSMIILLTKSWWSQISIMPFNLPKKSLTKSSSSMWKWN